MLRNVPRAICRSARSSRPSNCAATAVPVGTLEGPEGRSVRPCGSWTSSTKASPRATTAAQPPRLMQPFPFMTSVAKLPLVRSSSSAATSRGWENEGLPVAPLLSGSETLPSNLKLAVEAWPEAEEGEEQQEEQEEQEEQEDGDVFAGEDEPVEFSAEEDGEYLSQEDLDTIEALLNIPGLASPSFEVEVLSWTDGSPVATRELAPSVFGVPARRDVVHDVVRWQLARRRSGNGQTKRIGEISGSGRKVRPQKGGGVARAGHSRPPHWRGGAKAHGPRRRDFSFKLNKKFVKLGLRVALSARLREGKLKVVDNLEIKTFNTSAMVKMIKARGINGDVTFISGDNPQEEFKRSLGNIIGTKVLAARGANVYDIIKRENLVLTQGAVTYLEELLQPQ
ncbi:unnamed protein product [Scytosiphon promiscuus]